MFPNRSDLWVGLCRDRFGSEMMKQLREANLLASEDDDDDMVKDDRFERLFRVLAIKGMCKERSWTPEIPKDAQCLSAIGASETKEGEMPELKDLECKPEDYQLVLQIFGNNECDEVPLISKTLSGVSLNGLLGNLESDKRAEVEIDVPINLASSDRIDIISEARDQSYFDGDDCSVLLGPVHATVHLVRRTRDSKIEGLCIYSAGATGYFGGYYYVDGRHNLTGGDNKMKAYFYMPSTAISLEESAKDCFDRLEMREQGYFPDHAISTIMHLECEARTDNAGIKVDIVAKKVKICPSLHAFTPSCGHCKCRACLGEDVVDDGEFYSFNGVTFAHILENAKGWA